MKLPKVMRTIAFAACAALTAHTGPLAAADSSASPGSPEIGQPSKDSVWVPTPERMIRRLLQLADITSRDVVLDLGSGDGRIPIYAAREFGARAIGVELEANLIALSEASAREAGVADRVRFVRQDLFETDLGQATIITLYISPGVMTKLKPRLLALDPGTRVVSHQFTLDDWDADETVRTEGRNGYLWVVPADARGSWTLSSPGEPPLRLDVEQKHQVLAIRGERGGRPVPVLAARLRGRVIEFGSFDPEGNVRHYRGEISGGCMRGDFAPTAMVVTAAKRWTAARSGTAGCR